ncbi:MAG: hypothetical protein QRY71_01735 [Candidatus Rhabdochlamydia sp.]
MTTSPINNIHISSTIMSASSEDIIQELHNTIKALCHLLTENQEAFNKGLEKLYQKGADLIDREVTNRSFTPMDLTQIFTQLDQTLPWGPIKLQDSIHKTLAKTYRIFLELTWYRACLERRSISLKMTKNLQLIVSGSAGALPITHLSTCFEYKCFQQAAKLLRRSETLLSHYTQEPPLLETSFINVTESLKNTAHKIGSVWAHSWYLPVHQLRWRAETIRSLNDFNQIIAPIQSYFQEQGYFFTLCLATVYADLIKNPQIIDEVKVAAAKGLTHLAELRDTQFMAPLVQDIYDTTPILRIAHLIKEKDRYFLTRSLIKELIMELKDKHPHLNLDNCLNALKRPYADAIALIERVKLNAAPFRSLLEKKKELKGLLKELQDMRITPGSQEAATIHQHLKGYQKGILRIEEELKAVTPVQPIENLNSLDVLKIELIEQALFKVENQPNLLQEMEIMLKDQLTH